MIPQFLTSAQTAERLAVPAETLSKWRQAKTGPPFYRIGQQVRYSTAELAAWLEACRISTSG